MDNHLAQLLLAIEQHDTDYHVRYGLVLQALAEAHRLGLEAGFGYDNQADPSFDGFRIVAYIELTGGAQCSWHLPEHPRPWDGHSTEEKYRRIREYAEEVRRG